jgi:hypothetical protein
VVPPRGLAFHGGATYQTVTWEYLAYLGWPLLAVLLWAGLRYWHDLRIRTLFATWAVLELLALGGAHRWLPFHWLQGLPLLVSLLPDRIPVFAAAAAAAILAFGLDLATEPRKPREPREQGVAYRRAIPVAVAVLAVLPLLPMPLVPAAAAPAPAGWATVFARLRLAPQARVLVVPVPSQAVPYAIRWQADTGRPGQLPGGWFIGVNPAGRSASSYWGGPSAVRKAVSCLDAFWLTSAPTLASIPAPAPTPALPSARGCAAVTRTAVAYWKPDAIVADTSRGSPLGRLLVSVLGQPAVQAGQLLGWPARGRSAGPALPAVGPEAVEVDDDAFLATAGDNHDGLFGAGILLPVRDVRRDEDVVARLGPQADLFGAVREHELRGARHHVDRGLRLAVVVVAGAHARGDVRLAHPQLLRPGAVAGDRLQAGHAGGLAGVAAELSAAHVGQRPVPQVISHSPYDIPARGAGTRLPRRSRHLPSAISYPSTDK